MKEKARKFATILESLYEAITLKFFLTKIQILMVFWVGGGIPIKTLNLCTEFALFLPFFYKFVELFDVIAYERDAIEVQL